MEIFFPAQQYGLDDEIPEDCCSVLAKTKLQILEGYDEFSLLDTEYLRNILLPRLKMLENVVKELSPQVAGIVACTTHGCQWNVAKKEMAWCPAHLPNGKAVVSLRDCLRNCPECKQVLDSLGSIISYHRRPYYSSGREKFHKNLSQRLKNSLI